MTGAAARPARLGLLAVSAAWGLFWGCWSGILPAVQDRVGVSAGRLGVLLTFVAVGAIPAMAVTGRLARGREPVALPASTVLFGVAIAVLAGASSPAGLGAGLVLVGMTSGALEVCLSLAIARAERATGARLFQPVHAAFPVTVVGAAPLSGLARQTGVGIPVILLVVAILVATAGLAAGPRLRAGDGRAGGEQPKAVDDQEAEPHRNTVNTRDGDKHPQAVDDQEVEPRPKAANTRDGDKHPQAVAPRGTRWRVHRGAIGFGALGACLLIVENAVEQWAAVLLENYRHAAPVVASSGPAVYYLALSLGRLCAHAVPRLSARVLLGLGAVGGGIGIVSAALAPSAPLSLAAFALTGFAVGPVVPALLSHVAARDDENIGAVATATTTSYAGFVGSPLLVAGLSSALPLPAAVACLGFLTVPPLVTALVGRLPAAEPSTRDRAPSVREGT